MIVGRRVQSTKPHIFFCFVLFIIPHNAEDYQDTLFVDLLK